MKTTRNGDYACAQWSERDEKKFACFPSLFFSLSSTSIFFSTEQMVLFSRRTCLAQTLSFLNGGVASLSKFSRGGEDNEVL